MTGVHGSIHVAGRTRTFRTVRPPLSRHPVPAVLVLHGSNQTGAGFQRFTGGAFDQLATRHGAVVVYLDAYRKRWNDARAGSDFPARAEGYDDVAFTAAVIDHLVASEGVDPQRVHGVGFSSGGAMAIRLAHEIPERLAGLAVVAATMPVAASFSVARDAGRPLPMLFFHGTKDRLVPYAGGMASLWGLAPRGMGVSAQDTAAYFARRNGIDGPPAVSVVVAGSRLPVTRHDYRASGRAPVTLFGVAGGGHTVPGRTKAPRIMGATSTDVDAVAETAAFFGLLEAGSALS